MGNHPKKNTLGHPNLPVSSRRGHVILGRPCRAFCFIKNGIPWRCHGLRVACPVGAQTRTPVAPPMLLPRAHASGNRPCRHPLARGNVITTVPTPPSRRFHHQSPVPTPPSRRLHHQSPVPTPPSRRFHHQSPAPTPRMGHSSSSPWQRHGTNIPKKISPSAPQTFRARAKGGIIMGRAL